MSYMADRDHIAITSGDASTTRCKVSVPECPVGPPITVTHGESSDTYRRITANSEILAGKVFAGRLRRSVRPLPPASTLPVVGAHIHGGSEVTVTLGRQSMAAASAVTGRPGTPVPRAPHAIPLVPIPVQRGAGTG